MASSIMSGAKSSMSGVAHSPEFQLRQRARPIMQRKTPPLEPDSNYPLMSVLNDPGAKPADSATKSHPSKAESTEAPEAHLYQGLPSRRDRDRNALSGPADAQAQGEIAREAVKTAADG